MTKIRNRAIAAATAAATTSAEAAAAMAAAAAAGSSDPDPRGAWATRNPRGCRKAGSLLCIGAFH